MIPNHLTKYFWEYNISDLEINNYKQLIIERLLEKGNWDAVKWLFESYQADDIYNIVNHSSNLSIKTLNFWKQVFV
jgi:hypothetical protein